MTNCAQKIKDWIVFAQENSIVDIKKACDSIILFLIDFHQYSIWAFNELAIRAFCENNQIWLDLFTINVNYPINECQICVYAYALCTLHTDIKLIWLLSESHSIKYLIFFFVNRSQLNEVHTKLCRDSNAKKCQALNHTKEHFKQFIIFYRKLEFFSVDKKKKIIRNQIEWNDKSVSFDYV